MPVTFAGVPLTPPDKLGSLAARLDQFWRLHSVDEFEFPGRFGRGLDHLPAPYPPRRGPPEVGVLVWPNGASRFAHAHYFATGEETAEIVRRLPSDAQVPSPYPSETYEGGGILKIEDGAGGVLKTFMQLLPPRPVFVGKGSSSAADLYLLTLVDGRYIAPNRGGYAGSDWSSWASALSALFFSVANPWTVGGGSIPTVPAGYGTPSERWTVPGNNSVNPALLADAAFESVGLRLVADPVNTASNSVGPGAFLRTAAAAAALDQSQWDTFTAASEVLCGGRVSNDFATRSVPSKLAFVFYDLWDYQVDVASGPTPAFWTIDANLNGSPGADETDLALSAYAGRRTMWWGGQSGMYVSDVSGATYTGRTSADAQAALQAYAEAAGADFFAWALARTDATFRGVIPWQPTGLEDRVEWRHGPDGITTTVRRRPFGDLNRYGAAGRLPVGAVGFQPLASAVADGTYKLTVTVSGKRVTAYSLT